MGFIREYSLQLIEKENQDIFKNRLAYFKDETKYEIYCEMFIDALGGHMETALDLILTECKLTQAELKEAWDKFGNEVDFKQFKAVLPSKYDGLKNKVTSKEEAKKLVLDYGYELIERMNQLQGSIKKNEVPKEYQEHEFFFIKLFILKLRMGDKLFKDKGLKDDELMYLVDLYELKNDSEIVTCYVKIVKTDLALIGFF